jgi:hypothetical protein
MRLSKYATHNFESESNTYGRFLMRTLISTFILITLMTTLTPLAYADQRIVTPRLTPPVDGRLNCNIVNASNTNPLEGIATIYLFDGTPIGNGVSFFLGSNASMKNDTGADDARHCVVEITNGNKKDARVSVEVLDINFNPVATANGH